MSFVWIALAYVLGGSSGLMTGLGTARKQARVNLRANLTRMQSSGEISFRDADADLQKTVDALLDPIAKS